MTSTSAWLGLLLTVALSTGCGRRIPPHLLVQEEPPEIVAARQVTTLDAAVALMVSKDPLVRAPRLPDRESVDDMTDGEPLMAYLDTIAALEQGDGAAARELQGLADTFPTTIAVPLSRGYRLRMIENRLASWTQPDEEIEGEIAALLVALPSVESSDELPRRPLDWLTEGSVDPSVVRAAGDQWVLRGWLVSPDIPIASVAESLRQARYASLADHPVGALLLARADGVSAPPTGGWDALSEATWLALNRAAADRDHEQANWAQLRADASERLGTKAPVEHLLEQARVALAANASDDKSAGGALLALAAAAWSRGCTPRCTRLDRTSAISESSRWHSDVAALSRVWEVIALKDALDTLEVGHDTVLFPRAMVGLVDALEGTGAGQLDQALLRRRKPDASTWLTIGRAVGVDGTTDWPSTQVALGKHLANAATVAIDASPPGAYRSLLERIQERAVP
ncbi:MAG: hypothetical protein ACI8PZ_000748 [Myxococcota bacterium]|jgi:hypothetical protein